MEQGPMNNLLKQINEAANNWHKTKDPRYKDQWYKLVKEFANGYYSVERWNLQFNTSNKTDDGRHDVIRPAKFFRPLRHHKIKTNNIR